jgi:hypothetical protein
VPPYQPVVQVIGACSASDITNYIAACDAPTSTNTTCNAWFSGDASAACMNCLVGPVTDAGATGQGGIWIYQGSNIGPNVPGCLDKKGMSSCASAYDAVVECLYAAGCGTCTDQNSEQTCQTTIFGTNGACRSYLVTYQSACAADVADGGLLNGGPCSTDPDVLSVICGNGSGDGG